MSFLCDDGGDVVRGERRISVRCSCIDDPESVESKNRKSANEENPRDALAHRLRSINSYDCHSREGRVNSRRKWLLYRRPSLPKKFAGFAKFLLKIWMLLKKLFGEAGLR